MGALQVEVSEGAIEVPLDFGGLQVPGPASGDPEALVELRRMSPLPLGAPQRLPKFRFADH